jgi:hypothetical protein
MDVLMDCAPVVCARRAGGGDGGGGEARQFTARQIKVRSCTISLAYAICHNLVTVVLTDAFVCLLLVIIAYYWSLMGIIGHYCVLLVINRYYWSLMGIIGHYCVLLVINGYYWSLLRIIGH